MLLFSDAKVLSFCKHEHLFYYLLQFFLFFLCYRNVFEYSTIIVNQGTDTSFNVNVLRSIYTKKLNYHVHSNFQNISNIHHSGWAVDCAGFTMHKGCVDREEWGCEGEGGRGAGKWSLCISMLYATVYFSFKFKEAQNWSSSQGPPKKLGTPLNCQLQNLGQ